VRAVISFVIVAVAVVVQLTVVDRIAFPGGAGPDLVLLVVAALALAGGPLAGALTGFGAGLALDVAPPGSHLTGQNALVFCLVGYACGLLADQASPDSEQGHTALFEIVVVAAGAVVGEALAALLGVMVSDPRFTWPAITHVLPYAMAYDVLLCPFVLYAVAAALRLAGTREEGRPAGWAASQVRTPAPSASPGAIRQLAGSNSPRLRLSDRDPGSIGGLRGPGSGRPPARREPQLKLGRAGSSAAGFRSGSALSAGGLGAGASRLRFGGRRREGVLGGSLLGGASAGGSALTRSALTRSALRGSALSASRFSSSSMGRSLLGGSVFSRSASSLSSPLGRPSSGRGAIFGRSASLDLSSLRHRRNRTRPAGRGLAGHAPRFSRGSSFTRLTGALRKSAGPKSAGRKSPGRGWLRGTYPRRAALGSKSLSGKSLSSKSLGGSSLSRGAFGRSRFGRSTLGRSTLGRSTLGRSTLGRGRLGTSRLKARTPRLKPGRGGLFGLSGVFGLSRATRLHMPRPRAKRRWRTGGYR